MDARARFKIGADVRRRLPSGSVAASWGPTDAAPLLPASRHERDIKSDWSNVARIPGRRPSAADLNRGSRYLAKDLVDVRTTPLLMPTPLENSHVHGDCSAVAGHYSGSRESVERYARRCAGVNVKLTGAKPAKSETKWKPRATNHTSGAPWKYAQRVGPAEDRAMDHLGRAHEKQCYANV